MQALHEDILSLQESQSVPSISWKIYFKIGTTTHDVSNRFMGGDPGIIDSADYREGTTYVNELSLKLHNEDGFLTNAEATGIFDVAIDSIIEATIYGYFNIKDGADYKIQKYGGWVDLKRLKPNHTDFYCEVGIYSYFGLGDYESAANITTRYIDSNGLILWSTGLWVRDAAISGKVLKAGIHTIETRNEGGYQARLDDGEWVDITMYGAAEYTLANLTDTERVKVYYYSLYEFVAGAVSYIIVKTEGEQYPETFYYYSDIRTIIQEAFSYLRITTYDIEKYDIETYDERKVISILKTVLGDRITDAAAVVSDGEYKIFVSVATPAPTNLNQIWYYNYNTDALVKLFETTLNTFTKHRLVYEASLNTLFAFYDNDEEGGMLQAINVSTLAVTKLYTNAGLETADVYIRFLYYKAEKCFFLIKADGIDRIDYTGSLSTVLTDSNIETNGMSFIYEDFGALIVWLYYTKTVGGVRKIYRVNPSYPGTPEYVADFFNNTDYNNYYCTPFYTEGCVLMTHNNTLVKKMTLAGVFSTIDVYGLEVYSLFEVGSRLYAFAQSADGTNKRIGYFASGVFHIESENLNESRLFKLNSNWMVLRQKFCTFKNINNETDLALVSNRPGFLFRYSRWVTPYIYGEFDYTSKTIRALLQEIANNYLGFIRISYNKIGQYLSRSSSLSENAISIKKDYILGRVGERLYNDKYNGIQVSNGNEDVYYGDRSVNAKTLSLNLAFIPDELVMDMAKYFYDYYQILRRIHTIRYIPTFYNYDALDKADMSELGGSTGKIHKLVPKESSLEISIITEEV